MQAAALLPTLGTTSTGLFVNERPIVRNLRIEWVEPVHFRWIVGHRGAVRDHGVLCAATLIAVPDLRRNCDEGVILDAGENLVEFALRWAVVTIVIEDELDLAHRNRVVQRHLVMDVPALDYTGMDPGEVNFAEFTKVRVGDSKHVHDFAAFIENLPERRNGDSMDHHPYSRMEKS